MLNYLNDCDKEPIHLPNAIQPHGALIGVNAFGTIVCCSDNISQFSSFKNSAEALGKDLSNAMDRIHERRNIAVHEFKNHKLKFIELTEVHEESLGSDDYAELEKKLYQSVNLNSAFLDSLKYIQKITRYDRILVYQFKDDESGHVILELNNGVLGNFLGHHFPATDIPKQARALYILNRVRQIPDINYNGVGILRHSSISETDLDLSMSKIRSVSPVHIEYMKNMDVGCSFSISIVKDDRLWGLIACHSLKPKVLPNNVMGDLEKLSFALSERISNLYNQTINNRIDKISGAWMDLTLAWKKTNDNYLNQEKLAEICKAFECDGIYIRYLNREFSYGESISKPKIEAFLRHMHVDLNTESLAVSNLLEHFPSMHFEKVRGLAVKQMTKSLDGEIVLFRLPSKRTRIWAGQPTFEKTSFQGRIHPRKSFEKYSEEVLDRSTDWGQAEVKALDLLCHDLESHISNLEFATQAIPALSSDSVLSFMTDPRLPWVLLKISDSKAKLEWMNAAAQSILQNASLDFFIDSFQAKANVNLRSLLKQGRDFIDVSGDFANLKAQTFTLRLIGRNISKTESENTFLFSMQDRSTQELLTKKVILLSELNQQVFDSFKISNFQVDLNNDSAKISPSLRKLLNLKRDQAISWTELAERLSQNESKLDIAKQVQKSIAANQDRIEIEFNLGLKEDPIWIHLNAFIDYSIFPRRAIGINAFMMDITSQKMAAIRSSHMSKLAAVGKLSSNLAHELKNPIGILNLTAERLERKLNKPDLNREELVSISQEIKTEIDRVMALIVNMNQFSRLEKSESVESFDLIHLIKDVIGLFTSLKKRTQISVHFTSDVENLTLNSEPTKIQQILLNLLNNASDALHNVDDPDLEIQVRLSVKYAEVSVKDNGPGVPESIREKIFESFFTTKEKGKGTGLGLSISKETAHSLGGDLVLDSEVQAGAKFVLTLPIK